MLGAGVRLVERDPHVRSATVALGGADAPAVSSSDHVDDREPKPGAGPATSLVRTAEAVERARRKARRKPVSLVSDMKLDQTFPLARE